VFLNIRVVASETKKFTLKLKKGANDKLLDVSKEIANLLNENRYGLSFYYCGEVLKLSDRLGDN
jgi:hypothetical protein